jgi:hypothetical protein
VTTDGGVDAMEFFANVFYVISGEREGLRNKPLFV